MKKEKYITPETEAIEVREADVITTSSILLADDELIGIDGSYYDENSDLFKLFN